MKEKEVDIIELVKQLWGRRNVIIKWGIIGAVTGAVIAFSLPKQYEVKTMVLPENVQPSKLGSMGGLAALAGISTQESMDGISYRIYPEIVKSTPFILELANVKVENNGDVMTFLEFTTEHQHKAWWSYIVNAPGGLFGWGKSLFSDEKPEIDQTVIDVGNLTVKQTRFVQAINRNLLASYEKETGILTIGLITQNPKISKQISDSIVTNLQSYMTNYKTGKSRNDYQANLIILENVKNNYFKIDSIYATTVDLNRNLIKESAQIKIQRAADERAIAFTSYQQMAQKVEALYMKIQEETPMVTVLSPATTPLEPSKPNKTITIIGFAFMFGFISLANSIVRLILEK